MPEDETLKPAKIRLLSADAMKAIHEREMAKNGLPPIVMKLSWKRSSRIWR